MAPVDNPRVVIVVSIQEPQGKNVGGGTVSGAIFSQIAAGAMRILDVPPELPESAVAPVASVPLPLQAAPQVPESSPDIEVPFDDDPAGGLQ
jgi:hypothetical protein